jgi:PKD domain
LIKMRRYSLRAHRLLLAIAATFVAALGVATTAAQAVVVQDGSGDTYGVSLAPATPAQTFSGTGYSPDQTSGACPDPGLSADFGPNLPAGALCLRDRLQGTVLQNSELFAFTWDADRLYMTQTRGYIEQFLRDTADAGKANALSNPFASASQYTDASGGRAETPKLYGGGCIDLGNPGGYTCQLGDTTGSGNGTSYPPQDPGFTAAEECTPSTGNVACLTDLAIQHEVSRMLTSTGVDTLKARTGNTPLVVMTLPKYVEVCLDSSGTVCSVNSTGASATFCTYHSAVGGVPYVVLPWTANSACDPVNIPALPNNPTPAQIETDAGVRLVGSLSGALSASLVNPFLNAWFGNDGFEIDDVCGPGNHDIDNDPLGSGSYILQRAFNNAATLQYDAYTYFGCAPTVNLIPTFVVPSAVNAGDTVQFDGSATPSTLLVPKAGYHWDFGDGTEATGPSVEHSYADGGNYNVKLTVTDRGINTESIIQTVQVLGPAAPPAPSPGGSGPGAGPGSGSGSGSGSNSLLNVHLQMLPQSLKSVLRKGIAVRVSSNRAANGIATVWITRAAAKRAHIKTGKAAAVRIGLGTVSSVKDGTVTLRLHLSPATAKKLRRLKHVTMTVRLALVAPGNQRESIDAAGRY